MPDFDSQHGRLRYAREKLAKHKSGADAARALHMKYATYAAHENGTRGLGPDEVAKYAKAFKIDPEWLMWGTGNPRGLGIVDKIAQLSPESRKAAERYIDAMVDLEAKERSSR